MNSKKILFVLAAFLLVAVLAMTGCASEDVSKDDEKNEGTDNASDTNNEDTDTKEDVPRGGVVTLSMYSAPAGVFNPIYFSDTYENNLISFVYESLLQLNTDLAWEPLLAKDWEFVNDNHTLIMYLEEDVLWHDGEPFTAQDVYFTYAAIADPSYTGVRRATTVSNLVGFEEYSNGDVDVFEGVEVVSDHEVHFHFVTPSPLALRDAAFNIIPEHIFKDYDVADIIEAPETLEFDQLIGTGPYKASEYVTNEYYTLDRFEDYWRGAPYLEHVVWRVINQDVAPGLLETGEIDVITSPNGVSPADYDLVSSIPGIVIFETPVFAYQYMGFKLNYRPEEDVQNKVVNPDNFIPNEKLQSKELRQAIKYAINRQGIVDGLLQGHGTILHAPFPEVSWAYNADAVNDYPFDPEKAMDILDEAGFVDKNGDGWRQMPNGDELVLRLDYPTGNQVRERSAPIIQENLQDVGIKIDLRTPRDVGAHFDAVEDDEAGMDLFLAGWTLGASDPDPIGIWDQTTLFNFARWSSDYSQELLEAAIYDERSFDQEWRAETYNEWAKLINDELPFVFLYSQNDIHAYNDRVQGITHHPVNLIYNTHLWHVID